MVVRGTLLFALLCFAFAVGCGDDGGAQIDAAEECTGGTGCNGVCELGNDIGVGRYCTPGGGECADTPNRAAPFCTADSSQTDLWFCTRPCADDGQCGDGARCRGDGDTGPKGCVPEFCLGPGDLDAGMEDAASTADAGPDDGGAADGAVDQDGGGGGA